MLMCVCWWWEEESGCRGAPCRVEHNQKAGWALHWQCQLTGSVCHAWAVLGLQRSVGPLTGTGWLTIYEGDCMGDGINIEINNGITCGWNQHVMWNWHPQDWLSIRARLSLFYILLWVNPSSSLPSKWLINSNIFELSTVYVHVHYF